MPNSKSSLAPASLFFAALALLVGGCSFSASSESISKSISSPFESSSASSDGGETAYQNDVRDYTYAYVRSNTTASADNFDRGLGELAKKHGISNWEAADSTWSGIGAGLAKAKVSGGELEAYKQTLAGSDAAHRNAIQKSYDAYRG